MTKDLKPQLLPTLLRQGTHNRKLNSVGQFGSGLAIWGNNKTLSAAGVRIPRGVDDAWTLAEFEDALKKLKGAGVAFPLDMKFNCSIGEWVSYGFFPILQSFGGDLLDRKTFTSATNNDGDFVQGKSASSWVAHWVYNDHKNALGDDLVLIRT